MALDLENGPYGGKVQSPAVAAKKYNHSSKLGRLDLTIDDPQSRPLGEKPIDCLDNNRLLPYYHRSSDSDLVESFTNPKKNKWRLLSTMLISFGAGLHDSATGVLIPYLEKEYDIGYAVVSLIFISNAIGFILAAPFTHVLKARLGCARSHILSLVLIAVAHLTIIFKPPFPVVVSTFCLIGFGLAVNVSLSNVFCANLLNNTAALGGLHGGYGIGGLIGPLAATGIASHTGHWSFYYIITLAISLVNISFSWWAFTGYEDEPVVQLISKRQHEELAKSGGAESGMTSILKQALSSWVTILGAPFIFAYQGAEVSVSGWVVSFLINHRGADIAKVGYVTSGFWGGITIGRFCLSPLAHKIGLKLSTVLLIIGSGGFQLVLWFVPNIVGDAVALAIIGVLLGPIYPVTYSMFTSLLPANRQLSSLGFISAMGSSGGAAAPFFTGLIAQRMGTVVLHPICLGLYGIMICLWMGLSRLQSNSSKR
ncbi:hypothetical protein FQN57_007481 [Myotisia sp. PD_48]|nr:hypothetical protein FQN57_007481 [Myotisia sp. PD_48]